VNGVAQKLWVKFGDIFRRGEPRYKTQSDFGGYLHPGIFVFAVCNFLYEIALVYYYSVNGSTIWLTTLVSSLMSTVYQFRSDQLRLSAYQINWVSD